MSFLDPVLNPVFQPLLSISSFLAILVLALVISLLITLVYKYMTNQEEMKRLKDQQKDFQKRMKGLRSEPQEMMKVQKEAMKVNMEYMKHSFKPTLITMLPIILIFGWMNAHLAFEPINPADVYSVSAIFDEKLSGEAELVLDEGTEFAVDQSTGKISSSKQTISEDTRWYLKSTMGEHFLIVKFNDIEETKKVLITDEASYEEPLSTYDSAIEKIRINYNKLKPLNDLLSSKGKKANFSIFGWQPGWLGIYIVLSIIFSVGLRKVLKLH